MRRLPLVTYLSMDEITAGVGASQVLPYVLGLADAGAHVTLHSFEQRPPDPVVLDQLAAHDIRWERHAFGAPGARGGLGRVLRAARAVRGSELVHARSDLAAAATMLARVPVWVWDVRSFWADQRIELGMLRAGSPEDRVLRLVETQAARSSAAIITLATAAVPVLVDRHGPGVAEKCSVIPTCVDTSRFALQPLPPLDRWRLLLSGSLNRYYDVPAMISFLLASRTRRPTELEVLAPARSPWDEALADVGGQRRSARPVEVPAHVVASHAGLSVCRTDAGDSLRAAMPTKIGEFLSSGRPVVVNAGLGDMDQIARRYRCAVVLRGTDDRAVQDGVDELESLLADPDLPERCRQAAESHFALGEGVARLLAVYRTIGAREDGGPRH